MKEGWEKVGKLCRIRTGKLDANASNPNGIYPFFTCSKDPLRIDSFSYDCECVLIAGNGDLNVKYYNGKFDAYQRTYILEKKEGQNLSIQYLHHFFNKYIETLREHSIGGVIKYIKLGDLTEAQIPLPPISEQQAIVAELDKINEVIDLKKAQLKDLDLLAQSIFYDMFGDPIENPKGWEVKKLGDIASFKNGLNFGKNEQGYNYKLLGVSDFKANSIVSSDSLGIVSLTSEISNEYLLKNNDIVFVRSNGSKELVGRCVLLNVFEDTTFSGFCIRCRIENNDVVPIFLLTVLKTDCMRAYLTQSGQGCNISNLNQKILSSTQIPLPPLSLQQSFAEKIQAIESQKSAIKQSLAETETLLASRMDYWFN